MFESSSIAWVNFSLFRISCCPRPQSSLAKRGRVYIHGGCVVLSREGFVALGFESVSHDVECLANGGQIAEVSCVERKIGQSRQAPTQLILRDLRASGNFRAQASSPQALRLQGRQRNEGARSRAKPDVTPTLALVQKEFHLPKNIFGPSLLLHFKPLSLAGFGRGVVVAVPGYRPALSALGCISEHAIPPAFAVTDARFLETWPPRGRLAAL